jgi:hypothetical protein
MAYLGFSAPWSGKQKLPHVAEIMSLKKLKLFLNLFLFGSII